jgi:hypothetical protein
MSMSVRTLLALGAISLATPASAWDSFGHMEVAQIAWDGLTPEVRVRAAQLVRLNPQYVAWTVNVAPEKRDQIAFLRAATWPDFIKTAPGYISDGTNGGNRPPLGPEAAANIGYADMFMHKYWHFIDEPFSPDKTPLEQPVSPNAQTQIALFRKALVSPLATDDVKSYDLVWLLHLVGDVHHPLHATSRFSAGLPHGDEGGNAEKIDCGGCQESILHWFWDDAPGVSDNPEEAIEAAHALSASDPRQAAVREEMVWIDESFELAKQVAYQPPIGTGPFALNDAYKAEAKRIAKERVALAGVRLANLLNVALAAPIDARLGCNTATASPTPDLSQPENIDLVKKRMLYYRCNAFEEDVAKVLADAQRWIASRTSQVSRPAIVLDIDETSLSNWPRIYQDDFAYIPNGACNLDNTGDPCGDLDWQQRGFAEAIEPALRLYKAARCVDQPTPCTAVDVFFVTGRRQVERNYENGERLDASKPRHGRLRNGEPGSPLSSGSKIGWRGRRL